MPSFFYHIAFDLQSPSTPDATKQSSLPIRLGCSRHPESAVSTTSWRTTEKPIGEGPRSPSSELGLPTKDWRFDRIRIQNIDMVPAGTRSKRSSREDPTSHVTEGIVAGHGGVATKGRFETIKNEEEDVGWGVVRLFRDAEETPGLYDAAATSKSKGYRGFLRSKDDEAPCFRDEDCTTLCILAVPSYLTPSDFLGFVGEKTRDVVSHFRMVRTERGNRYMVLMRFRSGKTAREWRREWNGKPFDSMEVSASISMRLWMTTPYRDL